MVRHLRRKTEASEPAEDNQEQSQRFIETARELGCDLNDPRILEVLRGMASHPPHPRGKAATKLKGKDGRKKD